MRKRGIVISGVGIVLIVTSLGVASSALQSSGPVLDDSRFVSNMLEGMFDHVADESLIHPGAETVFSYSPQSPEVQLMWVVQIVDFEEDDAVQVSTSNSLGDDFGSVQINEMVTFNALMTEDRETYNFKVENTGSRAVSVAMMFLEDPENYDLFGDPDSPLVRIVVPLAVSAVLMIIGIIVTAVGAIIFFAVDWKKEKNRPRNR